MQWSLYLLILMGQCCFFTCQQYEYHFIEENKSWYEAQRYCREKYTDLANVFDMTDMSRLFNSTQNQGEAWIGLNNNTGGNRTWHWSLPGVEYIQNDSSWNLKGRTEPGPGNCGRKRDKLVDVSCNHPMWFICYDEMKKDKKTLYLIQTQMNWTQSQSYCRYHHTDLASGLDQVDGEERPFFCYDDKLILIKENKTWEEALDYCRTFHRGLVSITNPYQQRWAEERAKNASSPFVWLGLRYSCTLDLWFWVNDKLVCYEKWSREGKTEYCDVAVGMERGGQYEWFSQRENEKYNFFCFK